MIAFAVLLLGTTLIYTGILTTGRDSLVGIAIAFMGIGICIKPLWQFYRQLTNSPTSTKVVPIQKGSRRKREKGALHPREKQPTIH